MKLKIALLISLLIFLSSCKEEQNQILPYINISVDNVSLKMDSVIAVYDDSAGVMTVIGIKSRGGNITNIITIGFKFSTSMQIPRTYDASRTPIELVGIYKDSVGIYSTALVDSTGNPANSIGTGLLNLTSHNLQLQTIAGDFQLRLKEVDSAIMEQKTKVIQIKGSFQTLYAILVRGGPPPVPLKVIPNFD